MADPMTAAPSFYQTQLTRKWWEASIAERLLFYLDLLDKSIVFLDAGGTTKAVQLIRDYFNLKIPLPLPFANPDLFARFPGLYKEGSAAKTNRQFERQYEAALQALAKG